MISSLHGQSVSTNFDLFLHLKKLGLRCTGTLRENRVQEKNVIPKKSPKETVVVKHDKSSGINYITLVNSKQVSMASTAGGVSPTFPVKKYSSKKKTKSRSPLP